MMRPIKFVAIAGSDSQMSAARSPSSSGISGSAARAVLSGLLVAGVLEDRHDLNILYRYSNGSSKLSPSLPRHLKRSLRLTGALFLADTTTSRM
jgi:hypothetical protein